MTQNYQNYLLVQKYQERKFKMLKSVFPKATDDQINAFLEKEISDTIHISDCSIDNNYKNTVTNTNLLKLVNWIEKRKPITTEHGTMFKRHDESINLNANLLKLLLDSRKVEKNLMFECLEAGDKIGEQVHDTKQKIYKIIANS